MATSAENDPRPDEGDRDANCALSEVLERALSELRALQKTLEVDTDPGGMRKVLGYTRKVFAPIRGRGAPERLVMFQDRAADALRAVRKALTRTGLEPRAASVADGALAELEDGEFWQIWVDRLEADAVGSSSELRPPYEVAQILKACRGLENAREFLPQEVRKPQATSAASGESEGPHFAWLWRQLELDEERDVEERRIVAAAKEITQRAHDCKLSSSAWWRRWLGTEEQPNTDRLLAHLSSRWEEVADWWVSECWVALARAIRENASALDVKPEDLARVELPAHIDVKMRRTVHAVRDGFLGVLADPNDTAYRMRRSKEFAAVWAATPSEEAHVLTAYFEALRARIEDAYSRRLRAVGLSFADRRSAEYLEDAEKSERLDAGGAGTADEGMPSEPAAGVAPASPPETDYEAELSILEARLPAGVAMRVLRALQILDAIEDEYLSRSRIRQELSVPSSSVDQDFKAYGAAGDKVGSVRGSGVVSYHRGYLRKFLLTRWKPRTSG